ncbi:MAG: rhomboid family intramembrane serine protease [Mycobacterium sp.]
MSNPYPPQMPQRAPSCYRHPDRVTFVSCTRCGRPVCPECMRNASVGQQCVDCVQQASQTIVAPARTSRRTGPLPVVSYTLIAINVVVFLLQLLSPTLQQQLTLWPVAVAGYGEYYRLVTSAFVHYGILHIAFNMYALYVLGPPLEQHLGRGRFAALYGLSALGGSVLVYLLSPLSAATAGASGAIFGLFGATFVASKRLNLDVRWLVGLIAVNLVMSFTFPGVSWQGHIGGLVTGGVVAAAYVYAPPARRVLFQAGVSIAILALFLVLIVWRTTALMDLLTAARG